MRNTLWNRVPDETKEGLLEKKQATEDARNELHRINAVIADVEGQLMTSEVRKKNRGPAIAAQLLGRKVPKEEPEEPVEVVKAQRADGIAPDDLRDGLKALRVEREEATAAIKRADAQFRAAIHEALTEATKVAAAEYVDAARQLQSAWVLLESAQLFATNAAAGSGYKPVVTEGGFEWANILIPGSTAPSVPALKAASSEQVHGHQVVFSGQNARDRGVTHAAYRQLVDSVRTELGDWPFERRA